MEWIWEGSRYDPPYTYSSSDPKHYNASSNGQNDGGADQSRPRICLLEEYDFALVCAYYFSLSAISSSGEANSYNAVFFLQSPSTMVSQTVQKPNVPSPISILPSYSKTVYPQS
jgi:hypothetical protein